MSENDAPLRRRRSRNRAPLIAILFVFGLAGILILKERIAAVDAWVGKTFYPQRWQAAENCRQNLLAARSELKFTRLLERGEVHATKGGYLVDDVVIGYMGESGAETYATFSCYLDQAGNVVTTARQRYAPTEQTRSAAPQSAE